MAFCTAILMSNQATGQELKTPTLEELIPGGSQYRFTENIYGLQWWGDRCIKPGIDSVKAVHPQTGKESLLFTREEVNKALAAESLGKLSHLYTIKFTQPDKETALITLPGKYILYDFAASTILHNQALLPGNANADYSETSANIAYTIGNDLYVNQTKVTNEPEGIVSGKSVHRNEFGIQKGTFWSPDGTLLAFYRMDERMVTEYPLVDITARIAEVNNVRYPMAGMTSHKVQVGIYDTRTEKTVFLNTGDPTDRYFTNITWSPDGKRVYLIELNRDQNHAKLCEYDPSDGKLINILIEETHPKYVEPQHPIVFLPWDSKKFIYQSVRDGYNHLYLYEANGKPIKQLTSGNWVVQELVGFNPSAKEVIIRSTELSPVQSNVFRVSVGSGKRSLIGSGQGVCQDALISASGKYLIDIYSAPDIPRNIDMVDVRKNTTVNLLTAGDPYNGYVKPVIESGTIKAADDTSNLYYRIIKPADLDPARKYPVIVYVYGGPHSQLVNNSWQYGTRGWDIYMASKGYIVFTLDNRGTSNRGMEFEQVTFRQLGIEECKDQVRGIEFLKSLPYVDADRIGVHGWSYGGHMTTALMLRYPDIYKVGVAGGPVIDWKYYEIMYGERYMDTPETNQEGYNNTNLNNMAGNLKGKLLMIHDDHDDTCVPQHTLSFMKACVDARTYPDLFIYPGHAHNVRGRDRVHLHEKITRYFEENL